MNPAPQQAAQLLWTCRTTGTVIEGLPPECRPADAHAGRAQLMADDACCGRFAFGPAAAADWQQADLAAHPVHAAVHGAEGRLRYTREGAGRALPGDPRAALVWLANEVARLGVGLRAGDWASCGTCMVPLEITSGDRVRADYGRLGVIEIGLAD